MAGEVVGALPVQFMAVGRGGRETAGRHDLQVDHVVAHEAAQNDELVVALGEFSSDLRSGDGIRSVGDAHRTLEQIVVGGAFLEAERLKRQTVLHHLECSAFFTKAQTQVGHFRNGQTQVVGHDHGARVGEHAFQRFDRLGFLCAVHCGLHFGIRRQAYSRRRIGQSAAHRCTTFKPV